MKSKIVPVASVAVLLLCAAAHAFDMQRWLKHPWLELPTNDGQAFDLVPFPSDRYSAVDLRAHGRTVGVVLTKWDSLAIFRSHHVPRSIDWRRSVGQVPSFTDTVRRAREAAAATWPDWRPESTVARSVHCDGPLEVPRLVTVELVCQLPHGMVGQAAVSLFPWTSRVCKVQRTQRPFSAPMELKVDRGAAIAIAKAEIQRQRPSGPALHVKAELRLADCLLWDVVIVTRDSEDQGGQKWYYELMLDGSTGMHHGKLISKPYTQVGALYPPAQLPPPAVEPTPRMECWGPKEGPGWRAAVSSHRCEDMPWTEMDYGCVWLHEQGTWWWYASSFVLPRSGGHYVAAVRAGPYLIASRGGQVEVVQVADGQLELLPGAGSFAVSRDGSRLYVVRQRDGQDMWVVEEYDPRRLRVPLRAVCGHSRPVGSLVLSPDGQRLAHCVGDTICECSLGGAMQERRIASLALAGAPVWTADGKGLLVPVAEPTATEPDRQRLAVVASETGERQPYSVPDAVWRYKPWQWEVCADGLLFAGTKPGGDTRAVFRLAPGAIVPVEVSPPADVVLKPYRFGDGSTVVDLVCRRQNLLWAIARDELRTLKGW